MLTSLLNFHAESKALTLGTRWRSGSPKTAKRREASIEYRIFESFHFSVENLVSAPSLTNEYLYRSPGEERTGGKVLPD
jgi:hypothetical protein